MEFDAVLIHPRRARLVAQGYWRDRTINDALDDCANAVPDKTALTAVEVESGQVRRFTYRELARTADRIAVGLSRLGVGRNDVVAVQLPNWWQFTLTYLACSRIGAVINHRFNSLKLFSHLSVQTYLVFFFVSSVKGIAILENPSTNRR